MAKGKRNTPSNGEEKTTRKSPAEAKASTVASVRKMIRKSVARLQRAEMQASGDPEGNADLLTAYKSFDAELVKLVAGSDEE